MIWTNWATWLAVYCLSSPVRTFFASKLIQRGTDCVVDAVLRFPFQMSWRRRRWTPDALYWSTLYNNIRMIASEIKIVLQAHDREFEAMEAGFQMISNEPTVSSSKETVSSEPVLSETVSEHETVVETSNEMVVRKLVNAKKGAIKLLKCQYQLYLDFEEAVQQLGHQDRIVLEAGSLVLQSLKYGLNNWKHV